MWLTTYFTIEDYIELQNTDDFLPENLMIQLIVKL